MTKKKKNSRVPLGDKMYRVGLATNDRRCTAVSLRGKPCSYVGVHNCHPHQYCNLHYSSMMKRKEFVVVASSSLSSPASSSLLPMSEVASSSVVPLSTKPSAFGRPNNLIDTIKNVNGVERKDNAHTQNSNEPSSGGLLLNKLSSDQWMDKKVILLSGPHKSRIGYVNRWRNGWVTVRLSTTESTATGTNFILHNRRSYELKLCLS